MFVVSFLRSLFMSLSPETQAKIDQALADKEVAAQADASHQMAQDAVKAATEQESTTSAQALAAHQVALDSAHAALAALANELGVPSQT